ncbi:Glutaredoxin 3 (Grx2) [hydrothermal vent metagenome]|uniref:Glutaredoxin 3 (Grx2) n=1 Tax=hydrothermal vent metagenome TaxID=652676 RepID=A0A3B0SA16_9ZZZZ
MKPVTVYTTPFCPYCSRALKLLSQKTAKVQEIAAGFSARAKKEMIQRANGARTFPQIFIGDTHIGGCDELMALESAGKLDAMLQD